MLFNSLHFLVFFPIAVAVYFLLPQRFRWAWLLAASSYFYMAFIPVYVLILFFTIIVDYIAAIFIEKSTGKKRKLFLIMSIIANVGVLAVFKYYGFAAENLNSLAKFIGWNYSIPMLNIILPIGLSFHTFQAMSYTIEVYLGNYKAERHLGIYAVYVMFFPQLVAGPIERPQNLIHQFYERHAADWQRIGSGLRRMLWGFFKKIVIADNLASAVNAVYNHPAEFGSLSLLIATVFFAIQLYCDFSGYSDIAIGSARVLGFRLMENFNRPYAATSISEFWKRWHISLSTWFRDYLYIPLGGDRAKPAPARWYFNLILVFLISGLWHGANWTYIVWGGLHGAFLVIGTMTLKARIRFSRLIGCNRSSKIYCVWRRVITFSLVCFSFIFFRAGSLADAWYIVRQIFSGLIPSLASHFSAQGVKELLAGMRISGFDLLIIAAATAGVGCAQILIEKGSLGARLAEQPLWVRWSMYNTLILWIFFFGYFGEQPFIYFQF